MILEFYDPWQARDLSIKPILLECLQPGIDVIQRKAKYCPEWTTKEQFPSEPSLCPVESSSRHIQIGLEKSLSWLIKKESVQAGQSGYYSLHLAHGAD